MPYNVRIDLRTELEEILAHPESAQDREEYVGALAHLATAALGGLVAALGPRSSRAPWPCDVLAVTERLPAMVTLVRDIVPHLHYQLRALYGRYDSVQYLPNGRVACGDALGKVLPALDSLGTALQELACDVDQLRRFTPGIELRRRPSRSGQQHNDETGWYGR